MMIDEASLLTVEAEPLRRSAVLAVTGGAAAVLAAGAGMASVLPSGPAFALAAGGLYLAVAAGVLTAVADHHPHRRFGAANGVTLVRAVLACLIGGMIVIEGEPPGGDWAAPAAALVALALDGLDGRMARRHGTASRFGARFDMEVDALLLTVLSVLVVASGKVGAWVLLIAAARYLFVAAGALWPWLRGDLPPSQRRKAVCVVQGVALTLCLLPPLGAALAGPLAAAALALLAWSFGADTCWLWRQSRLGRTLSRRPWPV